MRRVAGGGWQVARSRWQVASQQAVVRGLLSVVWSMLLLAALVGCGGGADTTQPPEILYGQDVCDECDMIISEEKFASAYWTEDGEARRFDDVGEMLVFMAENPEPTASVWVHDINSAAWLLADDAWFVMNSGLHTPMGTGIAVVGSEAEAEALAFDQPEAVIMTFAEALARARAGELMNVHGMGE